MVASNAQTGAGGGSVAHPTTNLTAQGIQGYDPVLTGNNVVVKIAGIVIGMVETITVTRSVNRTPVYQVGSPLWVDAPVTQASVQVQITNLVPQPINYLTTNTKVTSTTMGQATDSMSNPVSPLGSLVKELVNTRVRIDVYDFTSGTAMFSVTGAKFTNDSVQVSNGQVVSMNASFVARDSTTWTA